VRGVWAKRTLGVAAVGWAAVHDREGRGEETAQRDTVTRNIFVIEPGTMSIIPGRLDETAGGGSRRLPGGSLRQNGSKRGDAQRDTVTRNIFVTEPGTMSITPRRLDETAGGGSRRFPGGSLRQRGSRRGDAQRDTVTRNIFV